MSDCVTEGESRHKGEEKREEREREGMRGRMTGNNSSLEERPHIEKLLSDNTGDIREHAETH